MEQTNTVNANINQEQIDWLMESATPSIRYLTARNLIGKGLDDPQAQQIRREITRSEPVASIFKEQRETGG